ncbi:MAG: SEC-C metal-binding domain-containing protein [Desulfobulbaceae bacterium]|nr:SEC-C metal-binding domain-containing protein [Desulfobulbaceae bacterium]
MNRVRVGRNDRCPCGSGRKHKYCCLPRLGKTPAVPARAGKIVSLLEAVGVIRQCAVERCPRIIELGVFVLYSNKKGDAWLFEVTDRDCVRLVLNGEIQEVSIKQDHEIIEIDYQYSFDERDGRLVLSGYENNEEVIFRQVTTKRLVEVFKRIKAKCSPELIAGLHLEKSQIETSHTA